MIPSAYFFSFKWFLIYLITTPDIFLNQTHFARLGIVHLELGKNILFGFGNGAEFRSQISEIESPVNNNFLTHIRIMVQFFVYLHDSIYLFIVFFFFCGDGVEEGVGGVEEGGLGEAEIVRE